MAQKSLRTFLKGKAMSNFICPECGMSNIDCGKDGYKTAREIELEKKLDIAIAALKCYAFEEFEDEEIECDELSPNYGVPVIKSFPYATNQELAQQALKEIEECTYSEKA